MSARVMHVPVLFLPSTKSTKVPWKYVELSPKTPLFLTLQFRKKDLTPTPNLLQIRPIPSPLGHILSAGEVGHLSLLSVAYGIV
jgi:hypothetical protein